MSHLCLLCQLFVFTAAYMFDPSTAADKDCSFTSVPPRQLDCLPSNNIAMVLCVIKCGSLCDSSSLKWYWKPFNVNGICQQEFGANNTCSGYFQASTIHINVKNEPYGGYYWCEVNNGSLKSQALLINPSCDLKKPVCSEVTILTEAFNTSGGQSNFTTVGASLCQPSSTYVPLTPSSSSYCKFSTVSPSIVVRDQPFMTESIFSRLQDTQSTASFSPGSMAPPTTSHALATPFSPSQFPTTVPSRAEVRSYETMVLASAAAALAVVTLASVLFTLFACICWRWRAKGSVTAQIPSMRGSHVPAPSSAQLQNSLEAGVSSLIRTTPTDQSVYYSVPPMAHNSNGTGPSCVPSESEEYNKLNHPQKAGEMFGPVTSVPKSKTSDYMYSLLQEGRYQSTSLLGSQSDQRYNHVNRAESINTLTISTPYAAGGNCCDLNDQTYGHLDFNATGSRGEQGTPGAARIYRIGNAMNVNAKANTGNSGVTISSSDSGAAAMHKATYWSGHVEVDQSDICETRKPECLDAVQCRPMECGPQDMSGPGSMGHYLPGTGPMSGPGPMACDQPGPGSMGSDLPGPGPMSRPGLVGRDLGHDLSDGSVWYEPYEQVTPTHTTLTKELSHNPLSEKQSTSSDDVPLVAPREEEGNRHSQRSRLTQGGHFGSDHGRHGLELQQRQK